MTKNNLQNRGNTNIMILIVIIFAALIYFNVDLRSIVDGFLTNPILQKLWMIVKGSWTNYLAPLGSYLWENITGLFS